MQLFFLVVSTTNTTENKAANSRAGGKGGGICLLGNPTVKKPFYTTDVLKVDDQLQSSFY